MAAAACWNGRASSALPPRLRSVRAVMLLGVDNEVPEDTLNEIRKMPLLASAHPRAWAVASTASKSRRPMPGSVVLRDRSKRALLSLVCRPPYLKGP